MLLTVTLLSRLEVGHPDVWVLHIVEWHILGIVGVGVVWLREGELFRAGALKVVYLGRSLTQTAHRVVTQSLVVVRIVQSPIYQSCVYRRHLHGVVVTVDVPLEVAQRTNRVAEEIGLQRLAWLFLLCCVGISLGNRVAVSVYLLTIRVGRGGQTIWA